jgi:hypothetical protein
LRTHVDGREQDRLPAYRVVVEAYGSSQYCYLGFVPSHYVPIDGAGAAAVVVPITGREICHYGGWSISVSTRSSQVVPDTKFCGWTALKPSRGATGVNPVGGDTSAYATTSKVPPVPPGGAVEFAVDYAAGTCRVAFYTPAAVAGGFVEAPHAKMELRFVAKEADDLGWVNIPAQSVGSHSDSGVELYPAAMTYGAGAIWRFAP